MFLVDVMICLCQKIKFEKGVIPQEKTYYAMIYFNKNKHIQVS